MIHKLLNNKYSRLLLGIFAVSFIIRVFQLGSLPFNFHEDEVLVGYVGRYILENGFDIYGNKWPLLFFNKFGDYYIIGPFYLSAISSLIFGMNEFAIPFPAAFLGSLIVFPTYTLSYFVTRNKTIGLIAAAFIAITPWHIVLSRSSVEGIMGSTIFLSGIVLLLYAIRRKEIKYLIVGSFLFLLCYWMYHPFRIYVPLSFVPLCILFPEIRKNKKLLVGFITATIVFFGLTFYISTTPWGSGRLEQTSIFSELSGVKIRIQQQIFNTGEEDIPTARIFNNKLIGFGREFINQYVTYFSPNFLFLRGGAESRYDMPDQGLLYVSFLIFLIAAFLPIGKKIRYHNSYLYYLIYLILLAPFPAAITYYGSPNINRSALLASVLIIPVAIGFYNILTAKYNKLFVPVLGLILLAECIYFWHQYSVQGEVFNAIRRNDAHRELVQYVQKKKQQYQHIFLPAEGNIALYYLFFNKDFNPNYATQFKTDARIDSIDNISFIDTSCPSTINNLNFDNSLIINRYNCSEVTELKKITDIKGKNILLGFTVYSQ
ncbi:MAG TPA: hypothetical protein PLS49_00215 [Candidatus Woesebacteria bacterium]|nr:hypothetical protein [Candidatus Woesebacteria bacterium]